MKDFSHPGDGTILGLC